MVVKSHGASEGRRGHWPWAVWCWCKPDVQRAKESLGPKKGTAGRGGGGALSRVTGKPDSRLRMGNQAGCISRTGQWPASGSKGRERPGSKDGNQEGCTGAWA